MWSTNQSVSVPKIADSAVCRRQTHCPVTDTAVLSLGDTTQLTPHPSQKCASLKLESSAAGWNLQAWSGCRSRVQELQQAAGPEPSVPALLGAAATGHSNLLHWFYAGWDTILSSAMMVGTLFSKVSHLHLTEHQKKCKRPNHWQKSKSHFLGSMLPYSEWAVTKGSNTKSLPKVQEPSQTWSGWLHEAP